MGFLLVGLGGGLGAMLRYGIGLLPYKHTFPLLTLVVNVAGAAVIGYITGISIRKELSPNKVLFFKTGLCGGFTTFSTFSLETFTLMQNGQYGYAGLYMFSSLVGCLAGVWCGIKLGVA